MCMCMQNRASASLLHIYSTEPRIKMHIPCTQACSISLSVKTGKLYISSLMEHYTTAACKSSSRMLHKSEISSMAWTTEFNELDLSVDIRAAGLQDCADGSRGVILFSYLWTSFWAQSCSCIGGTKVHVVLGDAAFDMAVIQSPCSVASEALKSKLRFLLR